MNITVLNYCLNVCKLLLVEYNEFLLKQRPHCDFTGDRAGVYVRSNADLFLKFASINCINSYTSFTARNL